MILPVIADLAYAFSCIAVQVATGNKPNRCHGRELPVRFPRKSFGRISTCRNPAGLQKSCLPMTLSLLP